MLTKIFSWNKAFQLLLNTLLICLLPVKVMIIIILKYHILLVSVSFLLKRSSKRIRILKMIFVRHRKNIPSILFSCNSYFTNLFHILLRLQLI